MMIHGATSRDVSALLQSANPAGRESRRHVESGFRRVEPSTSPPPSRGDARLDWLN